MKRPRSPEEGPLLKKAKLSKHEFSFNFKDNHKYQCENRGKFRSFYRSELGKIFYGSNKQAHQMGLCFRDHGIYACCVDIHDNHEFRFEREPDNPYDENAVRIIGSKHGAMLGYVPRMYNVKIGQLLRNKDLIVSAKNSTCNRIMEITCFTEEALKKEE